MRLKDRVAIVTGAGQGLGRAYARRFAEEGAKVILADVNQESTRRVVEEIGTAGGEAIAVHCDVTDDASTRALAELAAAHFGRVDILVNNAGLITTSGMKPFEELTAAEWDLMMAVNLRGPFLVCQAVVPLMKKQRYGKIVNVSSGVIWSGRPWYLHYVASKAGVLGLTRALSREVGDWNICVNAISPGATQTEIPRASVTEDQWAGIVAQQSIKHVERPEDVVGTVVFLASSDSDFITGQVINIDGGISLH